MHHVLSLGAGMRDGGLVGGGVVVEPEKASARTVPSGGGWGCGGGVYIAEESHRMDVEGDFCCLLAWTYYVS
jgi:hypothetical protein